MYNLCVHLSMIFMLACTSASTVATPSNLTSYNLVTPFDFGAKGDGRTDDHFAFQKAVDYCIANKRKLFVPSATFRVTKTIKLKEALVIEGESRHGAYVWFDPAADKTLFILEAGKSGFNMGFSNIKLGLRNFGSGKKNVHAFTISNTSFRGMKFDNVEFFGFSGYGIYLKGASTYGQNLAFRDLSFYRMGGMLGQNNDRGISNWWANLVIFENIHLDAYSGHSINLESPQEYLFDLRGWRTVSITNLLIEGSIKGPVNIAASVRIGGGYQPSGSNYLGLGNIVINGYWEEWSSKIKPPFSIESIEGISSVDINDYTGMDIKILANAQTVSIKGIRLHGLNIKDRIHVKGNAKVVLENVHNSSRTLVNEKFRNNPNIEVRSVNDKN